MSNTYYIPGLPEIRNQLHSDCRDLIIPNTENLVKLETREDKLKLIDSIRDIQYVNDRQLYDFYKEYMPEMAKMVTKIPVNKQELKNSLNHIFDDIPDESFEGKNILQCLTTTFNYVIRKYEIEFLITHINNDELKFNESYKYTRFQNFYFDMMKFNFNLDWYWFFFSNTQALLKRLFLKEVLFSEGKITDKKQELLNRVFNMNGQALADFDFQLTNVTKHIKTNRSTLKRTNIPLLPKYKQYEQDALRNITRVQGEVNEKISANRDSKKQLEEEIRKRHGFISKHTAKKLLQKMPYLGNIFKD